MSKRIKIGTTTFQCPDQPQNPVSPYRGGREWMQITVVGMAEDVKAAFVDGVTYQQEWDSITQTPVLDEQGAPVLDEQGRPTYTETVEVQSRDLSDYGIAGDVVDHRNGQVTVYTGKKTAAELQQETIDALLIELLGV